MVKDLKSEIPPSLTIKFFIFLLKMLLIKTHKNCKNSFRCDQIASYTSGIIQNLVSTNNSFFFLEKKITTNCPMNPNCLVVDIFDQICPLLKK